MNAWSPKAIAVAGMALAAAIAAPAYAQSNPFVPSSPATKQQVEQMLEERMREIEERLAATQKEQPETAEGTPGATPPGVPLPPGPDGAAVPGGMTPPVGVPGVPGQPGMPEGSPLDVGPTDPIDSARQNGVRFIGCINGVPKFVRATGERVTFSRDEIRDAVRAGFLPACR